MHQSHLQEHSFYCRQHSYLALVPCAGHSAFEKTEGANHSVFFGLHFCWDVVLVRLLLFNSARIKSVSLPALTAPFCVCRTNISFRVS